jgi:hypothetical protein
MARTLNSERLPGIPKGVIESRLARGKSGPLGMASLRKLRSCWVECEALTARWSPAL